MRQEMLNQAGPCTGQPGVHVLHVGIQVKTIDLCAPDPAHHDAYRLLGSKAAGKAKDGITDFWNLDWYGERGQVTGAQV
jgi:hypothetical protein